jgi:RND family efflux transporter MFP subunit
MRRNYFLRRTAPHPRSAMNIKLLLFGPNGSRKHVTLIAGAVLLAIILGLGFRLSWGEGAIAHDGSVWQVKRGPMDVRINETGELQAAESIRISPKVKGQATIVELVDEGTLVKKDDVIAKLDASQLEQNEATQAIDLENAQADLLKAGEEKNIQALTNDTNISKARLDVVNARLDVEKYGTVVLKKNGFLDKTAYGLPEDKGSANETDGGGEIIAEALSSLAVQSTDTALASLAADAAALAALKLESSAAAPAVDSTAAARIAAVTADADALVSGAAPRVDSTGAAKVDSTAPRVESSALAPIEALGPLHIGPNGEIVMDSTGQSVVRVASDGPQRGDAYQAFSDAEVAIITAKTDLETAQTDFQGMDKLLDRGFITKVQFIDADLKVVEATRTLESKRLAHAILRLYTYPKTLAQNMANLKKCEDAYKQAQLQARAQMAQKDANIVQAKAVYATRKRTLDDTRDQLSKTVITAPTDGIVLYGDERRPWDKDQIKVGGKVYEGMILVTFPSITKMIAATKVQEKDVNKVKIGQLCDVAIPAIPGVSLKGKVSKVANVAASGNRWMSSSEAKSFDVEVTLDEGDPRMKPGMSCQVAILVDTLPDCLYVPINAVFRQDGKDMCCLVSASGRTTQKPVTVGQASDLYVTLADGVKAGDSVLMYNVASSEVEPAAKGGAKPAVDSTGTRPASRVQSTDVQKVTVAAAAAGPKPSVQSTASAPAPSVQSSASAGRGVDSTAPGK